MALTKLYNFDETYTKKEIETFSLNTISKCRYYLKHLPLKPTLNVIDATTGKIFTITNDLNPKPGQVYFEYRDEYDYVAAKGLIIFNPIDVATGDAIEATYIPVASRVDAGVINEIITIVNQFNGNVWTKEDLYIPVENDIIDWRAINGRPELATQDTDGLISASDKTKLDSIPSELVNNIPFSGIDITPIGSSSTKTLKPITWGDKLNLVIGQGIIVDPDISDSRKATLKIDADNIQYLVGLTPNYVDALQGDTRYSTSGPSLTNPYVLTNDSRLSTEEKAPKVHTHPISDIKNDTTTLQEELANRSLVGHKHQVSDILDKEELKGKDGKTPEIEVGTTKAGAADTNPIVELDKISEDPLIYNLNMTIPRGRNGSVSWRDVTPEELEQLRGADGDKGEDGIPAAIKVPPENVHTGTPGSDVKIEYTGPYHWIDPSTQAEYKVTDLDITIPRGDTGTSGMSAAIELGTVTTTSNNTDAIVTIDPPTPKEIGGIMYNASKLNISLPRGPQGTSRGLRKDFTDTSSATGGYSWSEIDEDENYTLTINMIGAIPMSLAFEEVNSAQGLYQQVLATVRYDYDHIYIISDHKFTGHIWVDGITSA